MVEGKALWIGYTKLDKKNSVMIKYEKKEWRKTWLKKQKSMG